MPKTITQNLHNCIRTCLHLDSTPEPKNSHSLTEKAQSEEKIKERAARRTKTPLKSASQALTNSFFHIPKYNCISLSKSCFTSPRPKGHLFPLFLPPGWLNNKLDCKKDQKGSNGKGMSQKKKYGLSSAIWITFTLGEYCRLKQIYWKTGLHRTEQTEAKGCFFKVWVKLNWWNNNRHIGFLTTKGP